MSDKTKRTVCLVFLFGAIAFSGNSTAEQIGNGDFETGDLSFWTKTGLAWNQSPTDIHSYVSGWEGTWFAETLEAGETRTGTLKSNTLRLTGPISFRIAGWNSWPGVDPEFDHNHVALRLSSNDDVLDTVWAPNQNAMMGGTLNAPSYLGEEVYIEVVDDGAGGGFAWIAVDAFFMDNPTKAFNPVLADDSLGNSLSVLEWMIGDGAVEHDVYIGTNSSDVFTADTSDTTGIYCGRQSEINYSPIALVEGIKYFWRVDEVDSGSNISRGNVWSFTTTRPSRDLYSDTWVATDALGKTLPGHDQCGPRRDNKTVGIFGSRPWRESRVFKITGRVHDVLSFIS